MKRLHEKVGSDFKRCNLEDLKFVDYVNMARQNFLENSKAGKMADKFIQCKEVVAEG